MPSIQVAGRHGSYATQFWKASAWASRTAKFRNRVEMRTAYSRKALERRLVLPLDSHNWIRALEVLGAGYARLGRTPEHFQRVLRDMVEHSGPYTDRAPWPSSASRKPSPTPLPQCVEGGAEPRRILCGDGAQGSGRAAKSTAGSKGAAEILPAVDALRDKAYAGENPSNQSFWVTLVWSYCTLDQPGRALDTFHLARRRFHFSTATTRHMATLLLPVLCRHAQLEEAISLYETFLKGDGAKENSNDPPTSSHHCSHIEDTEARRWIAEAAARRGDLKRAQEFAAGASRSPNGAPTAVDDDHFIHNGMPSRPTIDSLFHHTTTSNTSSFLCGSTPVSAAGKGNDGGGSQQTAPLPASPSSRMPLLHTLSREAVRQLFRSLCRSGSASDSNPQFRDAVCCWEHLYGPALGGAPVAGGDAVGGRPDDGIQRLKRSPPVEDVHEFLNLLASLGRWQDALSMFCHLYLNRPASLYLSATLSDLRTLSPFRGNTGGSLIASAIDEASTPAASPQLDSIVLNLLFSSFPVAEAPLYVRTTKLVSTARATALKENHPQLSPQQSSAVREECGLQLPASAVPVTVVRLFDDLLLMRDDMVLTDFVMAAIGPALLQLGQSERVFDLLTRTPMMAAASQRRAPVYVSSEHQALKAELVALGYAAFALCSSSTRRGEMVRQQPHLFPPEVVRRLTSEGEENTLPGYAVLEGPHVFETYSRVAKGPTAAADTVKLDSSLTRHSSVTRQDECNDISSLRSCNTANTASTANLSLLDMKWHAVTATSAGSAEGRTAVARSRRQSSSATLTSLADDAIRRDYVHLNERRRDAFRGTHADAERDPRPVPKGLHDHASGWDFFGRGGEMVFGNHKSTPHPFTMRPKVMRDLRNPYRGWHPRQNSSLGHKENVIKWNGKSAV
ncbi:hypothetical protein JKF63_04382 [Porcisia hertigi]|uniref:Uncharacterized protein n=1 Tax=Porcisia hertigi TaxID=2761500 RepID=A0A836LAD6_9TRYP|nr:hypothetical protein JKF63_04382 [Porcisia hertigi]